MLTILWEALNIGFFWIFFYQIWDFSCFVIVIVSIAICIFLKPYLANSCASEKSVLEVINW